MPKSQDQEHANLGETRGMQDHEIDLIHDLSRRLDGLWRFDHCISNAEGFPELQAFWRDSKLQERKSIDQIKKLIQQHVQEDRF